VIAGFRCATCGTSVDIATPWAWRCPKAVGSDRHHVLRIVATAGLLPELRPENPFTWFGPNMAWHAFARAHGMTALACDAIVHELDDAVRAFAGVGFHVTPFMRHDTLSDALGFTRTGGVWIKDDTGNVGGSHKARHLFAILLHLVAAERLGVAPTRTRPRLAIASCGNAAIAAATLAGAVQWPIDVFVPPWAKPAVRERLAALGATIVTCPRLADDPPGDPCIHRFREAVNSGSVPFSVQGPENAYCLDGGRTLGVEIGLQAAVAGVRLDTVFAQTGGGAFATGIGDGLHQSLGVRVPNLVAVQPVGCAPLVRAAAAAARFGSTAPQHWPEVMWPWEAEPQSLATGILDDETYDWISVLENVDRSGGSVIAVDEPSIERALELISTTTTIRADATSTAGLAGVLTIRSTIDDNANVAIVVSGIRRD
jgi:threonine synthase